MYSCCAQAQNILSPSSSQVITIAVTTKTTKNQHLNHERRRPPYGPPADSTRALPRGSKILAGEARRSLDLYFLAGRQFGAKKANIITTTPPGLRPPPPPSPHHHHDDGGCAVTKPSIEATSRTTAHLCLRFSPIPT